MWSCNWRKTRIGLAVACVTALTACGFTPAYAPGGSADTLTRNITLTTPETRQDYLLAQQIERRLGHADTAEYLLDVDLTATEDRIAVTATNVTRRFEIIGSAKYTLTDMAGTTITSGTVSSFTGYSATGSTVATTAARTDAQERLMVILADQIVTRLIAAAPAR